MPEAQTLLTVVQITELEIPAPRTVKAKTKVNYISFVLMIFF